VRGGRAGDGVNKKYLISCEESPASTGYGVPVKRAGGGCLVILSYLLCGAGARERRKVPQKRYRLHRSKGGEGKGEKVW